MTSTALQVLLTVVLLAANASAAEDLAAEALIAPEQVTLGMSLPSLKSIRPKVFYGPAASRPSDAQQNKWPTMMEVIDLGQPSQVSFWYLFSNDKLIGLLRTRNLALVSTQDKTVEASSVFNVFTRLLGEPRQESLLRKGDTSFVPVRADVWIDDLRRLTYYFVATTNEITTAIVRPSDFPMEQVLIRPDPNRFEIEDKATQTVMDLPRSQPRNEDRSSKVGHIPTLPTLSLPQSNQTEPAPSAITPKADVWDIRLWALVITTLLGASWGAWQAIWKSKKGGTK